MREKSLSKYSPHLVVSKDSLPKNSAKVGKAVHDILSKHQHDVTVQEIIDEYQHKYTKELTETLENNANKYDSVFHVVVLSKKEFWATNVLRNWFIARETRPTTKYLRSEYPNHMSTVYSYDKRTSELKILWSLPTRQDCNTILKNAHLYDPQLVKWVSDAEAGFLDLEASA